MRKTPTIKQKNKRIDHEKQRQREAMTRLRAARRNDPEKYEEEKRRERERYYKRKKTGKIKLVGEMTDREKRIKRKMWREQSKAYYERQKRTKALEVKLGEDSPPLTPTPDEVHRTENYDGRKRQGILRRKRSRRYFNNKIKTLEAKIIEEKKKKEKYRMRLKRLKGKLKNKDSPTEKVEVLVSGQKVSDEVKSRLIVHEVLTKQLSENYRNLRKNAGVKRKLRYEDVYSSSDEDNMPLARLVKRKGLDGNEHIDMEKENILPSCRAKENDFVVVKFKGKKTVRHYVGAVQPQEFLEYPSEYLIRFLRKLDRSEKFVFPLQDDVSLIDSDDVVVVLPIPVINNREQYTFLYDMSGFENIS